MDTILVNPKRKYTVPSTIYDKSYNIRILELTKSLLEQNQGGAIQETLDAYMAECMRYFKEQDKEQIKSPVKMDCDMIMLPYKKINTFVKKKI